MIVLALALAALLLIPPLALILDARQRRARVELGFWTLARKTGGACHIAWHRRRLPVVSFELPEATARVHVTPTRQGWIVEVRAYQTLSFGFVALISEPPQRPALWYAPSMEVVDIFPEEVGYPSALSLESNDEASLRWLLKHDSLAALLRATRGEADRVEICAAHALIIGRVHASKALTSGEALERFAPALIKALRALSEDLHDLASAMRDAGEAFDEEVCGGCGRPLDDDPWRCEGCGERLHRGCRGMLSGCANAYCAHAADAYALKG